MAESEVIFLGIFLLMTIVGLKRYYHWKYLKEVREDLKRFANEFEFRKEANLKDISGYWNYSNLTHELLFPVFSREKNKEINRQAKKYAHIIMTLLFMFYSFLFLLITIAFI